MTLAIFKITCLWFWENNMQHPTTNTTSVFKLGRCRKNMLSYSSNLGCNSCLCMETFTNSDNKVVFMSKVVILTYKLTTINKLVDTTIKEIKIDTWYTITLY